MVPRHRLLFIALFVIGIAGINALPHRAVAQGSAVRAQASCTVSGLAISLESAAPISGIAIVALGGGSGLSDGNGAWSVGVELGRVTFRVSTQTDIVVAFTSNGSVYDYSFVDAGITDLVGVVSSGCLASVLTVVEQSRVEVSVPRPEPPDLPAGFVPSAETLKATPEPYTQGNGSNVPWLGYFWQSAPVIRWAMCGIIDVRRTSVVEQAIQRWQSAAGFGWLLVRDDAACNDDSPKPKLLIREETIRSRFSSAILGVTSAVDMEGKTCMTDGNGGVCWVGTVLVRLNPPGFDRLNQDRQTATVMHELGHALGLAHARNCGASIMWYSTGCRTAPLLFPGVDDFASVNELLTRTLATLRKNTPAAPAPSAPATPPAEPEPQHSE